MSFDGRLSTAFVYIPVPWNEKNQIIKSPCETVFSTEQKDKNTELLRNSTIWVQKGRSEVFAEAYRVRLSSEKRYKPSFATKFVTAIYTQKRISLCYFCWQGKYFIRKDHSEPLTRQRQSYCLLCLTLERFLF